MLDSRLGYAALIFFFLQIVQCQVISFDRGSDTVLAERKGPPVNILVAPDEHKGVARAANDLALDFGRVVGVNGTVHRDITPNGDGVPVIVGTLGTTFIDRLVRDGKLDVSEIQGQWESYIQAVIHNPSAGVPHALVIVGSDRRGTIYGIYDISETIGVSPWYWWADVSIKQKDVIYLSTPRKRVQASPSIKYRGIFINDEWELMKWSEKNFPKSSSGGVFTREFYKLLYELLLRLKANYLWPGMKQYNSFYLDDPKNAVLANEYGIVMGTSHHEPLARSYYEQQTLLNGNWDWSLNKENVSEFMEEGVKRTQDWETLYTVGMRGEGDRESPTLNSTQLEEIVETQQRMIKDHISKPLQEVGQAWSLYKEVGKYWEAGMNVSELVTLMWTDDNFGNLLRVPIPQETNRTGGAGVYYHVGYVGAPRSYEWISSTQLVKVWEQMHYAYQREARDIWILNVQDLKGWEVPTSLFLDMAYDISDFQTPDSTTAWLKRWAQREFGSDTADSVANTYNSHGRLVMRRKYETFSMSPFAFSMVHYDEASNVLKEWENLLAKTLETYNSLDSNAKGSFFELVLHPVLAGKTVVELYITKHLGDLYKSEQRTSTNRLARQCLQAFNNDAAITAKYHALYNSKWDGVMSGPHIGYTDNNFPPYNILPNISWIDNADVEGVDILGIAVQGLNVSHHDEPITLRSVDPYLPPANSRYIDIFTRTNGTFTYTVKANASYVSVTNPTGTLTAPGNNSDARAIISVDWEKAPDGLSWVSLTIRRANSTTKDREATAILPVNKTSVSSGFAGHVESNGAVAIEAAHYSRAESRNGVAYVDIPYYGRTHSGVKLWPVTAPSQTPSTGPRLTYNFYSFSRVSKAQLVLLLGGTLDLDPTRPLKVAYSLNSGNVDTKRLFPDYEAGALPPDWDTAVIRGGWNLTTEVEVGTGPQSLDIWLLEPGVVVQRILLDFGGLEDSALGPPESRYVKRR